MNMNEPILTGPVRTAIEIAVFLLLIFAIVAWCFKILAPFIPFLLWGAVIAVAVHKPFLKLRASVGGRNKLAVAIFVLLGLAIIILPAWLLGESLIQSAQQFTSGLQSGEFELPPPGDQVRGWPLVGEQLYAAWSAAAANLEG
jgi:predicted PurR-regulated permease PerM